MKTPAILIIATILGFVVVGAITENGWIALLGAAGFQLCAASIIWKIDFGTWNFFK